MNASRFPSVLRRFAPSRARQAGLVLLLVLLLHAALLAGWGSGAGPGSRPDAPRAVQVRQIVPATAAVATVAAGTQAAAPLPVVRRPPPATLPPVESPAATEAQPDIGPLPVAGPDTAAGGQEVPVYTTRLPPATTLQFELRRGTASGQAELDWQPAGDQYRLTLQGRMPVGPPIGWASQGGFDSAGIAPLRHTELRRGREQRAANFQRDSGRVTFSGPSLEHPLVSGGQDRLSWMLQLSAVVASNPALAEAGAQVMLWVVGTRGDAEVWTFTVQGRPTLDLPIGRIDDTVHLLREPRRPYDTQAQVWLDPSRHFLPAQALLRVRATGEGTEFRLQGLK